jgi:Na+-translocating ferredoxin:NAD+ oxidoreductase RNF subunit RnfB
MSSFLSILTAIAIVTGIALFAGYMLGYTSRRLPGDANEIVEKVDALLPQT